jgi:hypothetical protein
MAKKDEKPKQELKLTPEEYWKWMSSIENMGRRKAELSLAHIESKMMVLEYQNKMMQIQLHNKTRLEPAKVAVETSNGDYKLLKSNIEDRLGISLNDKVIDDVSYEVKDLPKNN